jgi:hypothetical protein
MARGGEGKYSSDYNSSKSTGGSSDGGGGKKKWIAGAIKHPGALHKQMGIAQGKKIPAAKLAKAAAAGGVLGRRARLAQTLKKMHK